MARVQYGTIVTALKGNIAGQTFQNGHVSKVLRNKGYRKGKSSFARQAQLSVLMQATSAWRNLTVSQRDVWNGLSGVWPFTDKFGNIYYGTGYQRFVAENTALILIGEAMLTAPDLPLSANNPISFSPSYSLTGGGQIEWSGTIAISQMLQIFASAPCSPSRNGNNVKYRLIDTEDMIGSSNIDFDPYYTAIYGVPPLGSCIYIKLAIRTPQFPIIQYPTKLRTIVVA
jgi:hypothetical protein